MAGRPGRTLPQTAANTRKAQAAPRASRKAASPSLLGRVFARPGVIVAGATFAAVMTGIVANALILQKGHHPSPLFSPAPVAATEPVPVPMPVPRQALAEPAAMPAVPAVAPAAAEPPADALAPKPLNPPSAASHPAATPKKSAVQAVPSHAAPAHRQAAAPAHKPAAAHKDPIAQLLGKTQ